MILLSPEAWNALLEQARQVIRARVTRPREALPARAAPMAELAQPAGCFVSLHAAGTHELRGCVGTLDTSRPLWEAVGEAAMSVLEDPRFEQRRVTANELDQLELDISVLSPPRLVAHPLDFEPRVEGIQLLVGERSGCFLPQVARETGWTREKLLDRLCVEKMGLPASAWRWPGAQLRTFSTIVVGPEPL